MAIDPKIKAEIERINTETREKKYIAWNNYSKALDEIQAEHDRKIKEITEQKK